LKLLQRASLCSLLISSSAFGSQTYRPYLKIIEGNTAVDQQIV